MKNLLLSGALVCCLFGSAFAQGPGKGKDSGPLPLQGKELPDVTAHDESGAEFPLQQKLKGKHGVIVFGCLT
jgi:cytochrome oxidase Cu insertion factor (SCO1/SenC/PrrC family)